MRELYFVDSNLSIMVALGRQADTFIEVNPVVVDFSPIFNNFL